MNLLPAGEVAQLAANVQPALAEADAVEVRRFYRPEAQRPGPHHLVHRPLPVVKEAQVLLRIVG